MAALAVLLLGASSSLAAVRFHPRAFGGLDCNGFSPIQHTVRLTMPCTDVRGFNGIYNKNTWDGHFFDNGHYIGHDEPDMTFLSSKAGSGNNVSWRETLPMDPTAAPTATSPGSDVSHWFELSVAPWFSMAMCDAKSYPQHAPCKPLSDKNAPTCVGVQITGCNPGAGSAFMELQFYPPGFAPFVDATSCDNTHWCSALTIDSLECTLGFASCNPNCIEPINFAFIARNGVPAGPPSPQLANLSTQTFNKETLLYNPGDQLSIHMWDAPAPGGGNAFKVVITDLTTGQTGSMQASAANGFANSSIKDCSGTPHNWQPEFNTAKKANISGWTALQTNVSTQYEIGHFTPCSSVTDPATIPLSATVTDTYFNKCHGAYETGDGDTTVEPVDAFCYNAGDTHGALNTAPDVLTGCNDFFAGGDIDFDGSAYWPQWPTGASATSSLPGSFVQQLPTTGGAQYAQFFNQTDTALSESTCTPETLSGCALPPPQAPGKFFPYWSRVSTSGNCTIEFGNVASGPGVNNMGQDSQYSPNQFPTLGYAEFEGPVMANTCT